jgi:uncharacterized protein YaaW (UPF0174 family)
MEGTVDYRNHHLVAYRWLCAGPTWFDFAVGGAAIATDSVPVVALLVRRKDPISTWCRASRDSRAAGFNLAVLGASIEGHGVAVVAPFRALDYTVATQREILSDVCDKLKVEHDSQSDVETIELNLLMKILADSMEKMTPEQLKEIVSTLDLKTTCYTKQAVVAALQVGVKMSGFVAYQIAVIVANAIAKAVVGRGLAPAANAGLARAVGIFAGPIGWAITAVWTLIDVAGPAYRVTMPAVIQVSFLRAKLKHKNA